MNLDRIRGFLGMRGNDGLTNRERKAMAEEYIRKVSGPMSDEEKEAIAKWRERRTDGNH